MANNKIIFILFNSSTARDFSRRDRNMIKPMTGKRDMMDTPIGADDTREMS